MVDKPDKSAAERAAADKRNRTIDLPAKEVVKNDEKKTETPAESIAAKTKPAAPAAASKPDATKKSATSSGTAPKPEQASSTKSAKSGTDTPGQASGATVKKAGPPGQPTDSLHQGRSGKPMPNAKTDAATKEAQRPADRQPADPETKPKAGNDSRAASSAAIGSVAKADRGRSTSPIALLVSAVLGGVIALVGAYFTLQQGALSLPPDSQQASQLDGLAQKVSALENASSSGEGEALSALTSRVADLETEVGAIAQAPGAIDSANAASLEARVTALETRTDSGEQSTDLTAMSSQISDLSKAVQSLQNAPAEAAETSTTGEAATGNGLAELQTRIANLEQSQASSVSDLKAEIGTLQTGLSSTQAEESQQEGKLSDLETQLSALSARLDDTASSEGLAALSNEIQGIKTTSQIANAATPVLISNSLVDAIQAGKPFSEELSAVSRIMPDDPAVGVLQPYAATGLPPTALLVQRFQGLRPGLAETEDSADEGPLQRLIAGAKGVIEIRSSEAIDGSDPFAVVSRINAALEDGDLTKAADEWQDLPDDRKAMSEDWANQLTAIATAQDLAARARESALARLSETSPDDGTTDPTTSESQDAAPAPGDTTSTSSQ